MTSFLGQTSCSEIEVASASILIALARGKAVWCVGIPVELVKKSGDEVPVMKIIMKVYNQKKPLD